MNKFDLQALEYVRNTNGGATFSDFIEDFDPVGLLEWESLLKQDMVCIDDAGRIRLTPSGEKALGVKP